MQGFWVLEDKISQGLASWQHKSLNKASHLTLVRSVLNSFPNYYMQVAWLPQPICDFIDRMSMNFLWKAISNSDVHLVGWNKISKPKRLGDLGIRKARKTNSSMLSKLVRSLHLDCDSILVQVLKHKYITEKTFLNMQKKSGSIA